MEAAIRVCSESGINRAKIGDVARAAGIGKGTVYEYFASKEELFAAMVRFGMEQYRLGIEEAIAGCSGIREQIINYSRYHLSFLRDHLDLMQVFTQINLLSKDTRRWLMEQRDGVFAPLRAAVAEAAHRGELRADVDLEIAVLCIIGTVSLHSAKRVLCQEDAGENVDHTRLVDTILRGLK